MFNRVMFVRPNNGQRRSKLDTIGSLTSKLGHGIVSVWDRVRHTIEQLRGPTEHVQPRATPGTVDHNNRDRLRQALNIVFAIGQVVTTYFTVATGADESFSTRTSADPPIIPAEYTFTVIWSIIYASTIAYAIYQALPQQRSDELLGRIGFWTAAAFAGTSLWLVAAVQNRVWLTVAIFFGILGALLVAFVRLLRVEAPRSTAERYLVVLPISIYAAWATIGTIANMAAALDASGFAHVVFAPQTWAMIMLAIAGIIASFVATVSRGNVWYVLTIVWAFAGIVVANISTFPLVGIVAAGVGLVVILAWLRARFGHAVA